MIRISDSFNIKEANNNKEYRKSSSAPAGITAKKATAKQNEVKQSQKTSSDNTVSKEKLQKLIKKYLDENDTERNFKMNIDNKTDTVVISIIDAKTSKVIQKIPGDEILRLKGKIKELTGIFLKEKI